MTFVVGHNATRFAIHTNALELPRAHIEFTRTIDRKEDPAVDNAGEEVVVVRLPEHSAIDFQMFVAFVYTGRLYWHTARKSPTETFALLGRLWAIGQTLLSTGFKDAVADAAVLVTIATKRYPTDIHKTVSTYSCECSAISKFLVDVALSLWTERDRRDLKFSDGEGRFFFDVSLAMAQAHDQPEKWEKDWIEQLLLGKSMCVYHEHDVDSPCKKPWPGSLSLGMLRSKVLQLHLNPAYPAWTFS